MSKKYVIGDVHGNYKGLIQALDRSPYKIHEDTLISLGDLVDGGKDSALVVDYLADLKYQQHADIILIKGNHDEWFKHWLKFGINPVNWLQGQYQTAESYIDFLYNNSDIVCSIVKKLDGGYITSLNPGDIPASHVSFLNSSHNYYVDENNNCFVHGGFDRHRLINEQDSDDVYYWDRDLWYQALSYSNMTKNMTDEEWKYLYGNDFKPKFKIKNDFSNIFIGHTTTMNWKTTEPIIASNIINIDTGSGFAGKVTIMDVDTKEYWQSDTVAELYGQPFHR